MGRPQSSLKLQELTWIGLIILILNKLEKSYLNKKRVDSDTMS